MTKMSTALLAAATTCLLVLTPAKADKITAFYPAGNPGDPRPCSFYKTRDYGGEWFELPMSDSNYAAEVSNVETAYHTKDETVFSFGGPVNSYACPSPGSPGFRRLLLGVGEP